MCGLLPFPSTACTPSAFPQPPAAGAPSQPPPAAPPKAAPFASPAAQPSPARPATFTAALDSANSVARHAGAAY